WGRSPKSVRLACLIHAASVHSEPGSNSPLERNPESQEPHLCGPARYSAARMLQEPRRLTSSLRPSAPGPRTFLPSSSRLESERGCHILHGFQRAGAPDWVFRAGVGSFRGQARESRTIRRRGFEASVSLSARRPSCEGRRRSVKRRRGSRTFWRLFSSLPVFRLACGPKAFLRGAGREPETGS